ncbi:unnamed protein product [Cyclocybe aegerita]|uniref:Protein kinase domain-containing protein n=1 Tax=Cyclocybe aegerita TaxID=1973307 RepID=A0A8S0WU39_CYCAE|nr:unnamed protein product [Cyclocybe aegerita]
MSLLSLNCWLFGDDVEEVFTIEISPEKTVSILKDVIKEENAFSFPAKGLSLWKVSLPLDDLDSPLSNLRLDDYPKLSSGKKLSTFFKDADAERLHIIVKRPKSADNQSPALPQLLLVNCLVAGDPTEQMFTIEISPEKNVSILKSMIKEENAFSFPAKTLSLWKVSLSLDVPDHNNFEPTGRALLPQRTLASMFPGPLDPNCIHIFSPFPPSSFKPVTNANDVAKRRKKFLGQRLKQAPSDGAKPLTFEADQQKAAIYFDRPSQVCDALPIELLHPVFGQFMDDCKHHTPTTEDNAFVEAFVKVMRKFFGREKDRQKEILKAFNEARVFMKGSKIEDFSTDGDLSIGLLRYLIAEIKNEIGSTHAEPYLQGILYYLESTRDQAVRYCTSVLPCIVIALFGPFIGFAGVAWTDRPNAQILSTVIPCHFSLHDSEMRDRLARHLGALRLSLVSLAKYYEGLKPVGPASGSPLPRNPMLPYPSSFSLADSSEQQFTYESQKRGNNLLFFGRLLGGAAGAGAVCIKFTRRYCREAHEFCASRGFAPKLHGFERLPGGWYMIVMDDTREEYEDLFEFISGHSDQLDDDSRNSLLDSLKASLSQFHQANYVHGDMRNSNIMVKKSGLDGSFLLVDFDWSGTIGEVRYPLNINNVTVTRPSGAFDGELITAEHDTEMLDHIWTIS